jgi:hypothetical protein
MTNAVLLLSQAITVYAFYHSSCGGRWYEMYLRAEFRLTLTKICMMFDSLLSASGRRHLVHVDDDIDFIVSAIVDLACGFVRLSATRKRYRSRHSGE